MKFRLKIVDSISLLYLFLGLLFPCMALADVDGFIMRVVNDGTALFDGDNNPGNDMAPNNFIVRTHDQVRYRLIVSANGADANVVFTLTIPNIPASVGGIPIATAGEPLGTWRAVPPQCTGLGSVISNGGRTLICELADITAPGVFAVEPTLDISGRAPNGAVLSFFDGTAETGSAEISSSNAGIIPATYQDFGGGSIPSLDETISASPRFDLVLSRDVGGVAGAGLSFWAGVIGNSGPPGGGVGSDGLVLAYNIQLIANGRRKGMEMLQPGQDIEIIDDISTLIAGGNGAALAVDWTGPVTSNNLISTPNGCEELPINTFFVPRGVGSPSTNPSHVFDDGDCTDSQPSAGANTLLTISGADTSLDHVPTSTGVGVNPTTLDRYYAISNQMVFWVPISSLNGPGLITPTFNRIDFNPASLPVSISGQVNVEPNLTNNEYAYNFLRTARGEFSKKITPRDRNLTIIPQDAPRDLRVISDGRVNIVSPGQLYSARLFVKNTGSEPMDHVLCDKIDNARQVVMAGGTVADLIEFLYQPTAIAAAPLTLEWGVQVGDGSGNINDSWIDFSNQALSEDGGNELIETNSVVPSGSLYADTNCPDADPSGNTPGAPTAFFPDLASVVAAGFTLDQITMFRSSGILPPGHAYRTRILLKLRSEFKYDVDDNITAAGTIVSPFSYSYLAGDMIPDKSHVPNEAVINAPSAGFDFAKFADVIEVQNVRFLRIRKSALPASGSQLAIGQQVKYILTPNYTTPNGLVPGGGDVIVTDVLPPGLAYLNTVAGPGAPVVQVDTPAPGYTTLRWTYSMVLPYTGSIGAVFGDLPPIEFTASVLPSRLGTAFLSGDSFVNWTTVDGLNPEDFDGDSDCVFDFGDPSDPVDDLGYSTCGKADSVGHSINSPPGLAIFKEVLTPFEEVTRPLSWRTNWSVYRAAPPPDLNIIDVLPWVGDGRSPPSSYSGSIQLSSITPVNDLATEPHNIYVTDTAPGSISENPQDASNLAPGVGASIWCLVGDIGTAGCPSSLAVVRATLVEHVAIPEVNELYSLEYTFNTTGNIEGDLYTNVHSIATITGGLPPVTALPVVAQVVSGSIGDRIWLDNDADGIQDGLELGIPGVTLTLHNASSGVQIASATTNAAGNYLFPNIISTTNLGADYEVRVDISTLPPGLSPTFDLDMISSQNLTSGLKLGINEDREDVDFGYAYLSNIVVNKALQVNVPAGLPWQFALISSDPLECPLPLTLSNPAITADGSGGTVEFSKLLAFGISTGAPCSYDLAEVGHPDWSIFTSDPLTGVNLVPSVDTVINVVNKFDLPASLGSRVWQDSNANGVQDIDEPGVEGVLVELLNSSGDPILDSLGNAISTLTGPGGSYLFTGLPPGSYQVRFSAPTDGMFTSQFSGAVGIDSDVNPLDGLSAVITLAAGDENLEIDAGIVFPDGSAQVMWNGFCDQQNFIMLTNTCSGPVSVNLSLFGSSGTLLSDLAISLSAGQQMDFDVNNMDGFSAFDYGLVNLATRPGGCISGNMGLFSPIGTGQYFTTSLERNSLGGEENLFALSDGRISNSCYLPYNTFQPSLNLADQNLVATHWLQLVNLSEDEKQGFTINRYDPRGNSSSSQVITLNPFARQDIAAGHESGARSQYGLVEIVPNQAGANYSAELFRYGTDGTTESGERMSSFALADNCSIGEAGQQYLLASRGANASSWLELYNLATDSENISVKVYGSSGSSVASYDLSIPGLGARHLDITKGLAQGETGLVEVSSDQEKRFIVKISSYYYRADGRILAAETSEGRKPLGFLADTSYNSFRNQLNWLRLFNSSEKPISVELTAFSSEGESFGETRIVQIAQKSGSDLNLNQLFSLNPDRVGRVHLSVSDGGALVSEIIRVQHNDDYSMLQDIESFEVK